MSEVARSSSNSSLKPLETIIAKQFKEHNIEIFGTKDEPLFKASDIGKMLGLSNIRESIKNFSSTQKVVIADTLSGSKNVTFLTEIGLYKVIFKSTKPWAEQFQEFVCNVIKEIRKTGEYNLRRQLAVQQEKELELTNQIQQSNEEISLEREEKERLAAELEVLKKTKKYEEIEKTGCNYTLKTDSPDFYRNGMSKNKDCKNRVSSHQTSNEQKIEILHEFKTSCPRLLESCIHYALEMYRSNSGREFFKCKLDHIVNIVDIICHVIDTCRSSNQNISRDELIEKVLEKLEYRGEIRPNPQETPGEVGLALWVRQNIRYQKGAVLLTKDLFDRYYAKDPGTIVKSKLKIDLEEKFAIFRKDHPLFSPTHNTTLRGWNDLVLVQLD